MNDESDSAGTLDGDWSNGVFKLRIKGNRYVSFCNGARYGKGTITYDTENFTLTSTHARWLICLWIPFVERVTRKYHIDNDGLTVYNVESRYSAQSGV